jgi:hypothetical protein
MTRTYFEKSLRLRCAASVLNVLIWAACILFAAQAKGQTNTNEVQIPTVVNPGLDHLLALADPAKNIAFDPQLVTSVLDFIERPKEDDALYYANRFGGLTSAYYDFDISQSLESVVTYSFNPDIPAIATMPSSVRLFQWADIRGNRQQPPRLIQYLDQYGSPVILKGLVYFENTPDLTSGAYYGYKCFQSYLLFEHRRRNVLVAVTRQADVSTVGKKGYVLGDDDDWDYYYSGKTGLTLPALGWVKSYMYDSSGINIYYEIDPGGPRVRCAMFKWLRAGWSKINMVQKKHIYQGLKRFAMPFKEILEHRGLPPAAKIADDLSQIMRLSDATLISRMEIYSRLLEKRYNSGNQRSRKWPADIFENKNHWLQLSRQEMESALVIEYMKHVLGKNRPNEVGALLSLNR